MVPVPVEEYQVEKIKSCEHSGHIYWMKDKQIKDVQLHKTEQSILKHFDFESVQIGLDQRQLDAMWGDRSLRRLAICTECIILSPGKINHIDFGEFLALPLALLKVKLQGNGISQIWYRNRMVMIEQRRSGAGETFDDKGKAGVNKGGLESTKEV